MMGVLCVVAGWLAMPCAAGAETNPDQEARRIFSTIMSPYCPGLLLVDCTSSQAAVLRDSIKVQLRRGRSADAIVDELVAAYGPEVLALPPSRGAGLVAWLGPIAAMAASLLILFWWLRQRREPSQAVSAAAGSTAAPESPTDRPDLRARLQEELKRLD